MKIYLAGGLFNAGERVHNLFLEHCLKEHGYDVILPQRESLKFIEGDSLNIIGVAEDCRKFCIDPSVIYVGNADGPDSDSGTGVEYGMAITSTGRAVVYRTDFRTFEERELGLNAMFKIKGTTLIYEPCFFTELSEVEEYYKKLTQKIHEAIQKMNNKNI